MHETNLSLTPEKNLFDAVFASYAINMPATNLSRDVVKWLQSLDLSWQVKNPKWDFSNGYLVAEILYWYFSSEITMHSFYNGKSIETKLKNWHLLKECFKRHEFNIPEEIIEGTIHCKEDAAVALVNQLYETLTRRSPQTFGKPTFDDSRYQQTLEPIARSNAVKALKNNISVTELKVQQDILTNQQKAQAILHQHVENRANERLEQPGRFSIKMSPGQRCLRKHPGPNYQEEPVAAADLGGFVRADESRAPAAAQEVRGDSMIRELHVRQQPKYVNPANA